MFGRKDNFFVTLYVFGTFLGNRFIPLAIIDASIAFFIIKFFRHTVGPIAIMGILCHSNIGNGGIFITQNTNNISEIYIRKIIHIMFFI